MKISIMGLFSGVILIIFLIGGCAPGGNLAGGKGIASTPAVKNGSCADPMAIIRAFYDSNDAGTYDKSLDFLSSDISFSSWSEGVNGHHMTEKFLTGRDQVRPELSSPGLRRSSGKPDAPIFHIDQVKISGESVVLMLLPDRTHPNGRPYNPYRITAVFADCTIKSLNVVEQVTWL
jgi:hypothetical protein